MNKMWNLKACIVCLRTDLKLYNMDSNNLRFDYNLVSGLETSEGDGLPSHVCYECEAYIRRCKKFKEKCLRSHYTLQQILSHRKEITESHLKSIDKQAIGIMPALSFIDTKNMYYNEVKFQWINFNKPSVDKLNIAVMHVTTNISNTDEPPSKKAKIDGSVEIKLENSSLNEQLEVTFDPVEFDGKEQKELYAPSPNIEETDVNDETYFDNYIDVSDNEKDDEKVANEETSPDGMNLEEEYASMVPISLQEAKAVVEIYNMSSMGTHKCPECGKGYHTSNRLNVHLRMHDKYVSGMFFCELCNYYYKTDYLLKTHMTEKHMYKYICKKCPEVSFDRTTAKQHYIWGHLQKGVKRNSNWYETRPTWLSSRGGKRVKAVVKLQPVKKRRKMPIDFPTCTPISPKDQYEYLNVRKKSKNYLESEYKCELCFKGFREIETYNKHMRKHDPTFSGPLECDICHLRFKNTRYMYKHMIITHLFRYSCQHCGFHCFSRGQAYQHYRWHKNVTYKCTQCDRVFRKHSTRLTHIRIKHPSTALCNICGHSFVSEAGLYFHKKKAHSTEEIQISEKVKVEAESALYCAECDVQFLNHEAYVVHLGSSNKHASVNRSIKSSNPKRESNKPRKAVVKDAKRRRNSTSIINNGIATGTDCEVCGVHLRNDVAARRHYQSEHPGTEFLKRYMCDVCGHTTKQYANLLVHMRTHTREKPYACPHCDRRFSMTSNRDRHLVVHTGEKKYECEHCHRRFTQSTAVKLHIQTVHLKIPYAPWDKKNRKRRKDAEMVMTQPEQKVIVETATDYINAYMTYNDE